MDKVRFKGNNLLYFCTKVPYLYSIFLRLCLRGLRLVVTGDICLNMRLCSWDRSKAYRSKALPNRSSETTATAGFLKSIIGQLPRVSGEDPERIRVDSVFETSVCSLSVC